MTPKQTRAVLEVERRLQEIQQALGARFITAAERRRYRGLWAKNARQLCRGAALALAALGPLLKEVPYQGDDVEAAFAEAHDVEDCLILLEGMVKMVKDTLLLKRATAHRMATAVLYCMQALLTNPFVDDQTRFSVAGIVRRMRTQRDLKNQKISDTLCGKPAKGGQRLRKSRRSFPVAGAGAMPRYRPAPGFLTELARPNPGPLPLREAERRHIAEVLQLSGWDRQQAAAVLGISRPTLNRKIRDHGLLPPG